MEMMVIAKKMYHEESKIVADILISMEKSGAPVARSRITTKDDSGSGEPIRENADTVSERLETAIVHPRNSVVIE